MTGNAKQSRRTKPTLRIEGRESPSSTFVVFEYRFDVGRSRFQAVQKPLDFGANAPEFGNHLPGAGVVSHRFEGQEIMIERTDGIFDLVEVDGNGAVRIQD